MLDKMLVDVLDFHLKITKMPIPEQPTLLTDERRIKRVDFLSEEITEFDDAVTVADQADALVDLIYVAMGGLLEMGIRPGAAFDLVHKANMAKVGGTNKRGSQYEAAKPDGWKPPDWDTFLKEERGQYAGLTRSNNPWNAWDGAKTPKNPKILLLGYGRHGKDTVAEILRESYGLSFTSSSMFCAEKVMTPAFDRVNATALNGGGFPRYRNVQECFDDRHNHRKFWFEEIERFNTPDKAALGRAIFAEHDIYCGLRSAKEFHAVKAAGLYDLCVWVDRSDHVPPESRESCTVEPWMADLVLDNNGSMDDLVFNIARIMENLA